MPCTQWSINMSAWKFEVKRAENFSQFIWAKQLTKVFQAQVCYSQGWPLFINVFVFNIFCGGYFK